IDAKRMDGLLDWIEFDRHSLKNISGIGNKRAQLLEQRFREARERPFHQWLEALGAPGIDRGRPANWTEASARDVAQWQQHSGASSSQARKLVAFFGEPQIRQIASRLAIAGVDGFSSGQNAIASHD